MKDKIMTFGFSFIIIFVGIVSVIIKDSDISFLERRKLVTTDGLKSNFFEKIEDYLSDQFPLRNELLSINASYERNILGNKEKNDVYLINDMVYEKNYPLDEKSVNDFVRKINYIKNKYFQNNQTYYSVIPDKTYFLEDNKYLKIDFDKIFDGLSNLDSEYINIIPFLEIDDYYNSDIHIKQEEWLKILPILNQKLDFNYYSINYQTKSFEPFYGASYSKVIKMIKSDKLNYLVNDYQNELIINHLEYGRKNLYDLDKLGNIDSYDVFLSGPSSFIEITNPNLNDKELIVFRDSFASSLVPLLTPYYSKITIIDLRYINTDLLDNYLKVNDNCDVLFLYSTLIINSSDILKVNVK